MYLLYLHTIIVAALIPFMPSAVMAIWIGFSVFLISSVRESGPDFDDYQYMFESLGNAFEIFSNSGAEPLWLVIIWAFDLIGLDVNYRFGIVSILSFFLRWKALKVIFSGNKWLVATGLLAYLANDFVIKDLGQLRSGLSASFMLYFLALYLNGRRRVAYVYAVFSVLFHYSYIVPILLVILAKNMSIKMFCIIIGLLLLLINGALQMPEFLSIGEFNKILQYTQSETYLLRDQDSGFVFIYLSLIVVAIGFSVLQRFDKNLKVVFAVYICAPIFFAALFSYPVLASRVPTTVLTLNCIMIPAIVYKVNYGSLNVSAVYTLIAISLSLVGMYYMNNYLNVFS